MPYRSLILSLAFVCNLAAASEPEPLTEDSCSFLLSAESGESDVVEVPGLSVLYPPEDQPTFVVEQDDGARLDAVICWRSRGEFADADARVLDAGFLFSVKSGEAENEQTLVLERTEVGHRVRVVAGPTPIDEQADALRTQIGRFNRRLGADAD